VTTSSQPGPPEEGGRARGGKRDGAGRPGIGSPVLIRLGGLLDEVGSYAARHGLSRADAVRDLVRAGLAAEAAGNEERP
jgi:hypothetical protein